MTGIKYPLVTVLEVVLSYQGFCLVLVLSWYCNLGVLGFAFFFFLISVKNFLRKVLGLQKN